MSRIIDIVSLIFAYFYTYTCNGIQYMEIQDPPNMVHYRNSYK